MHDDGFAVERALLIGIGGELDGRNRTGLLGNDGPQIAIVVVRGQGQQGFESAWVEVGQEDGGWMRRLDGLSNCGRWRRCS